MPCRILFVAATAARAAGVVVAAVHDHQNEEEKCENGADSDGDEAFLRDMICKVKGQ